MRARTESGLARLVPAMGRKGRASRWRGRNGQPRIWAHRGDSAHVTENTLEAFAAARAAGADGVELDVHACRSGEIVVFHDEDLQRLAGRPERIADLTLSEIRTVVVTGGHRIPTLEEALEATDGLELNVEIKSPQVGRAGTLPTRVARAVVDARAGERVLISSFDPWALVQAHQAQPGLSMALLFHAGEALPVRRGWLGPWLGAAALHPEHVLCTEETVAVWRRRGFAVNAWTVDAPERIVELARWGVDGLFCNDPAAARKALAAAG
jgi:glycerophosphoryl diester phosphodiesterase